MSDAPHKMELALELNALIREVVPGGEDVVTRVPEILALTYRLRDAGAPSFVQSIYDWANENRPSGGTDAEQAAWGTLIAGVAPAAPPAPSAVRRADVTPRTWDELRDFLEANYPLDSSLGVWPSLRLHFDDGRSQQITVRPRGAAERGRVELITPFTNASAAPIDCILRRTYDLAFGGIVTVGETLHFRDTFRLGKLNMEEFNDLLEFVAGIGDILEQEYGHGDKF